MARTPLNSFLYRDIYRCLADKLARKGITQDTLDAILTWLLDYDADTLAKLQNTDTRYVDFLLNAPALNPLYRQVTGSICGIKVETIEDPALRLVRVVDKLTDMACKGKALQELFPKTE